MASSSSSIVAILLGSALSSTVHAVAGLDCGVLIPKDKSQGPGTWQPCYSFVPPLKDILSNPHSDCKDDGNYCHGENTWSAMCKPIPEDFPMFEGKSVDMYVPTGCAGTQYDTCYEAKNFGPNLSAADIYEGDYPSVSFDGTIAGHDNSISFFVGGSFTSQEGAEVEGKIVVLGDFTIGPSSTLNSLVQVGAGSQVVPEGNQVVVTVGGDFIHGGLETANVLTPQGHVEIGGTYTDGSKSLVTKGGKVSTGTSIDTQAYLQTFEDLAEKSAYWSTLYPNGRIIPAVEHQMQNVITFAAGDDDCLQVFHVDRFDLGCPMIDGSCDMVFDGSLKDKTILINVASYEDSSTGDRVAELYDIGQVFDYSGTTVQSDTKASILWNVYDAKKFTLCGGSGGPQMPGSVLIPNGSLDMKCPGLDGRIMVKGDVVQDREGSEFHAYEFDPPCDLPLPPDFKIPSECGCPTRPDIVGSEFASICGHTGVRLLSTIPDFSEGSGNEQPDKAIEDIFFNIDVGTNDRKVSFRAQNPFDEMVDMYIEYEKPYESENFRGIIGKALTCEAGPDIEKCGEALDGDAFEAVCIDPRNLGHDGEPYAFVTVYFVDKGNSLFTLSKNAAVHECCEPTSTDGSSVVQYNFIISCTCPETGSEAARSLLRGS